MPPFSRAVPPLLLAASVAAQCPPGAPLSQDTPLATAVPEQGAARVRWQAAQDALKGGDAAAAKKHLLAALEFLPQAPMLLLDLALLTRDDKDTAAMWAERFVRAASDAQGKLKLDAAAKKQAAAPAGFEATLKPAQDLAAARAAAIAEVAKFVDRYRPAKQGNAARAVLVRWAAELLLELGADSPAALAVVAPGAGRVEEAFEPDCELVFQALLRVLQKKPTAAAGGADAKGEDQRIRAARILVGLRRQGAFKDLQGPPPHDPGKYADEAQRVLDEHAAAAATAAKVFTIAELEAMTPAEADAFTRAHRDWRAPGIATSPGNRFRIETICGHDTLLAVAKTIELHHARLVNHFGSDPFEQRQGLVRIVPESSDLETEGAPFWWAGGFQAGDRTTVRFAWGEIPGLGRALTHELTHRFDGVLHAFVPPWYGEGHAQWTANHYAKMADAQCVETYLDKGAPAHTWYKGYGDRAKFETLLTGKVADYRDNYFAGYSLYAFLRSYPPTSPRYRDALDRFERTARAGQKDPLAFFTATFCDGKHSRPAKFDDLFADWQTFCRSCYEWLDNKKEGNQWLAGYSGRGHEAGALVMDPPTWSWARNRAEPFFGQDHAVAATLLLQEVGDHDGTIAAGVWSTTVDGWRADTARAVLQALVATKANDAAAAFAAVARRRFPELASADAAGLLAALPRTKALLDALAARAEALAAESPTSCGALVQDHARIATLFGIDRLKKLPLGSPAAQAQARCLGIGGYSESSLTGYEDRRVRGLWYATNDGDLHVGREKPREGTGTLDRAAHQRDAFVHTVEWLAPGAYVVRGHVQITTSFASGAIVFGHTRRDRDLRLAFSTGDFDYATGRSDKNEHSGSVGFHLQGLWERDEKLPGTGNDRPTVSINAESPAFDFALHVRGPRVLVEINGEAILRYSVHDGAPVEGHVGFAMNMGAVKVQQLTVQRRAGELADLDLGLALDAQPACSLEDLLLLPTRGIPTHRDGTLVLWLPKVAEGSPADGLSRVLPALAKLLNTPHDHPQDWVLAVPRDLPKAARDAANAAIAEIRKAPLPVIEHDVGEPLAGEAPFVLFVDASGVLRAAVAADEPGVHTRITEWSRKFRGRGA